MEFNQLVTLLYKGALETLYMVILSTACSYLAGIPLLPIINTSFIFIPSSCKPFRLVLFSEETTTPLALPYGNAKN